MTSTVDLTSDNEVSTTTSPKSRTASRSGSTGVQIPLYSDSEDKTEEVKKQFTVLKENQYISRLKNVFSAANDFMTCDCAPEYQDGRNHACGSDSDCINRLTKIECVDNQCGCGNLCLNQRFQTRDYADTSIFSTADKGYGMRANVDIPANTFIIEYMGDIIDAEEYKSRKLKYDSENIKHFYFMMIQDNEIIDATKRASLGRYLNHSCDPNAYIEKWVVDKRFRMGIFAKRDIIKGEEICFDYNVDRYGAEPQKCYCGAPNCLGVMGGKTQSETVRLLPHIITEALGVRPSDEKKWVKEQKKNGIKITSDNIDSNVNVEFVKALHLEPLDMADMANVSSCLMQPDLDIIVMDRILERVTMEGEEPLYELLKRFHRLHGIQALGNVLKTLVLAVGDEKHMNTECKTIVERIVFLFENWPQLKSKNALQDSVIEDSFKVLETKGIPDKLQRRIDTLIGSWSELEVIYRIPKKLEPTPTSTIIDDRRSRSNDTQASPVNSSLLQKLPKGPAMMVKQPWGDLNVDELPARRKIDGVPLPPGWEWALEPSSKRRYFYNRKENKTQWEQPEWKVNPVDDVLEKKRKERERERIREQRELEMLRRKREQALIVEQREKEERMNVLSTIIAEASGDGTGSGSENNKDNNGRYNRDQSKLKKSSKDTKEVKWMKSFAGFVPNVLRRYEEAIGRNNLKNCAKDIVHILTEKEMKRHKDEPVPEVISEERKSKIKTFCKSYMERFLTKYEEKKKRKAVANGESSSEQTHSKRAKTESK